MTVLQIAVLVLLVSGATFYKAFHMRNYKNMQMHLPVVTGKLLDVGCAGGRTAALLLEHPDSRLTSAYGIDPGLPEKHYIPAQKYDGQHIPFDDQSYDTCLSSFILHHVDNGDDVVQILKEMGRVGKRVVVTEDYVDTWAARFTVVLLHEWMALLAGLGGFDLSYSRDGFNTVQEWHQLFDQAGLVVVKEREYDSMAFFFPFLRHVQFVLVRKGDAEALAVPVEMYEDTLIDSIKVVNFATVLLWLYLAFKAVSKGVSYVVGGGSGSKSNAKLAKKVV